MIGLEQLDNFIKSKRPGEVDIVLYLFWEKGISYEEFCELPIPYILSIIKTNNFVKKEEDKAYKRSQRKAHGSR